MKTLTCVRVGNKQKKIDISIPKLDTFLHKVYIHVARKVYTNVYLFEKNISPLHVQKNNREFELITNECILIAIRESIPTEAIIRAYLDESVEQEEEVTIEPIQKEPTQKESDAKGTETPDEEYVLPEEEKPPEQVPAISNVDNAPVVTRLTFNDVDSAMGEDNQEEKIVAPKDIDRLEQISVERALQRRLEEEEDDSDRIKILDSGPVDVLDLGITSLDEPTDDDSVKLDFEEL